MTLYEEEIQKIIDARLKSHSVLEGQHHHCHSTTDDLYRTSGKQVRMELDALHAVVFENDRRLTEHAKHGVLEFPGLRDKINATMKPDMAIYADKFPDIGERFTAEFIEDKPRMVCYLQDSCHSFALGEKCCKNGNPPPKWKRGETTNLQWPPRCFSQCRRSKQRRLNTETLVRPKCQDRKGYMHTDMYHIGPIELDQWNEVYFTEDRRRKDRRAT